MTLRYQIFISHQVWKNLSDSSRNSQHIHLHEHNIYRVLLLMLDLISKMAVQVLHFLGAVVVCAGLLRASFLVPCHTE